MALELFWTSQASISFERIGDYIFENFGIRALTEFESQVESTLSNISNFPEMFRLIDGKMLRKGRVSKHTLVLYRIHKAGIEVLLFVDQRQDLSQSEVDED
jgi:plasmid stabilization system protein ParE